MKNYELNQYIERIKIESNSHKFLKEDFIKQLITTFKKDYFKESYLKTIKKPLEIALQFYKDFNPLYYEMLINAINNQEIIINSNIEKSDTDTENKKIYIKPSENDSDLFMMVHEFAHYIDLNCNPPIIPNEYSFLCEVFSLYMEKQLELWLDNQKYEKLIKTRKNNRMYFESKMLTAIEYQLMYERLWKETGKIELSNLDIDKVKWIMRYDYDQKDGLVNYLLRYPLANILSDYLINNSLVEKDQDISKICLATDLYKVLEYFKNEK